MHIDDIKISNYLSKSDATPAITLTISGMTQENLAKENQPIENKYVLQFVENVKPMVLNTTNAQLIALVTGSKETNDWIGKQITLWHDPSVSFGGELKGGIRVQVPQPAQPQPVNDLDDKIPF